MPSPPKPWERGSAASSYPSASPASPASTTVAAATATSQAATASTAPALPQRPAELASAAGTAGSYGQGPYGSRYAPGATSSYSSPYSRMGYGSSYGGYGSSLYSGYGGGYGGLGYGGMGGYGGFGGYGMGMGMPGMMPQEATLGQRMEAGTAATFQMIQALVGAVGGFAQMLESTFMATHSSFFAMVGVAEQFGHLRNYLGQVLSIFALIRWLRSLLNRMLGREPAGSEISPESFRAFESSSTAAGAAGSDPNRPKLAKKPLIVFLLTVIGLPYLMNRLVRIITARQEEEARLSAPPPLDPSTLTFVRATFAYDATSPEELTLRPDDIVAVLTPPAERTTPGWWRGRLRDGSVGWFPSTHVTELPLKQQAKEVAAATASPGTGAGGGQGKDGAPGAGGGTQTHKASA